jgi:hypothetical protein
MGLSKPILLTKMDEGSLFFVKYCGLCYRVAGWLNCFINGCWILVAACMVLASRRAPKGALIVSLSLLVMILPEDLLKEACFFVKYCGLF